MEHGIKRLNRELIRRGAILNIYKDTMQLPNGEIEEWDYICLLYTSPSPRDA